MGLSLGVGVTRAAGRPASAFSPLSVPWDDFYDFVLSNIRQNSNGTGTCADGDPVGYWQTRGVNGDALQPTAGERGTYRTNGIAFGASSSLLMQAGFSFGGDFTLYFVGRRNAGEAWVPLGKSGGGDGGVFIDASNNLNVAIDGVVTQLSDSAPTGLFALEVFRSGETIESAFTGGTGETVGDANELTTDQIGRSVAGSLASGANSRYLLVAGTSTLLSAGNRMNMRSWIASAYPGASIP